MKIEVLLTEAEIAQEFFEAVEARDLPEKFFYWFPLSVRAWLALAKDSRFQSLTRAWEDLTAKGEKIARHFDGQVSVISLGAGDGARDNLLLESLRAQQREVRYFPVDASQALLETACSGAEDAEIETLGIKADISSPIHLVLAADATESPKLFLMSGNTLGAFDPMDQVRHLTQCLHESDRLIVDGEIYDPAALAGQENSANRDFAFAPLASIGITAEDGQLRFEQKRDDRHEGLHVLTKHFRADRDLRITISAEEIELTRGDRLCMNFSYAYTREAFHWLLAEHGHLKVLEESTSPDGRFVTALCSR